MKKENKDEIQEIKEFIQFRLTAIEMKLFNQETLRLEDKLIPGISPAALENSIKLLEIKRLKMQEALKSLQ